ncbi:Uncharacterised protein [Serratia fonticola]|nr:Uncharacterised protein [Serratia fonticola]CAI1625707.1 Uncharacterised protein [Serratia fonticola]CAI1662441.1 Uncharacterised protein [Serratia fonticola]
MPSRTQIGICGAVSHTGTSHIDVCISSAISLGFKKSPYNNAHHRKYKTSVDHITLFDRGKRLHQLDHVLHTHIDLIDHLSRILG